MNKNILLLWQGQLVSQLGMQAYTIAMMFWLMENPHSSILMSLVLTLSILPNVLFGPIAGVIADRLSRKKIIIVTDLIRGFFEHCHTYNICESKFKCKEFYVYHTNLSWQKRLPRIGKMSRNSHFLTNAIPPETNTVRFSTTQ